MGDHGAHLIAPQPTSGHEGKDRQAEADAEQRRINPVEDLLGEQGEDGGVDRNQIGKGNREKAAHRKQCLDRGDGEPSRQQDGDKERTKNAGGRHRHEKEEGEGKCSSRQLRQKAPCVSHDPSPNSRTFLATLLPIRKHITGDTKALILAAF